MSSDKHDKPQSHPPLSNVTSSTEALRSSTSIPPWFSHSANGYQGYTWPIPSQWPGMYYPAATLGSTFPPVRGNKESQPLPAMSSGSSLRPSVPVNPPELSRTSIPLPTMDPIERHSPASIPNTVPPSNTPSLQEKSFSPEIASLSGTEHIPTSIPTTNTTSLQDQLFSPVISSQSGLDLSPSPDGTESSSSDPESGPRSRKKRRHSSTKRQRVSLRNRVYSTVEGAMIGKKAYEIPRQQPLREPEQDQSRANKRFTRQIKDLVSRAERLCLETNPWLIICAQQPGAGPAIHYESPRLRLEAIEDATKMVVTFQDAISALNLAKVKDARDITQGYELKLKKERDLRLETEKAKETLLKEKEAAESEATRAREGEGLIKARLEEQQALIAVYEAKLKAALAKSN